MKILSVMNGKKISEQVIGADCGRSCKQRVVWLKLAAALVLMIAVGKITDNVSAAPPYGVFFGYSEVKGYWPLHPGDYMNTEATAEELEIAGDSARTVEAWVYVREFNGGGVFSLDRPDSPGEDFALRCLNELNKWQVQLGGADHDIDFSYSSHREWVHFAVVYDGSEITVYAGGVAGLRKERNLDTPAEETFRVGAWQDKYFDGIITEVRVWNQALNSRRIERRMNRRLDGNESGLTGYWRMNEGKGNKVRDHAGDNQGRLLGDFEWYQR